MAPEQRRRPAGWVKRSMAMEDRGSIEGAFDQAPCVLLERDLGMAEEGSKLRSVGVRAATATLLLAGRRVQGSRPTATNGDARLERTGNMKKEKDREVEQAVAPLGAARDGAEQPGGSDSGQSRQGYGRLGKEAVSPIRHRLD